MNWNGGSLSRSRNAKTSISAVQKRYFAKVRGTVQKRPQSPPDLDLAHYKRPVRVERSPSGLSLAHDQPQTPVLVSSPSIVAAHHTPRSRITSTASHKRQPISSSPQLQYKDSNRQVLPKATVKLSREEDIGAKRVKLLAMPDWCGVKFSQRYSTPVKIKFPDIEDRDQIGKRRSVRDVHQKRRRSDHRQHRKPEKSSTKEDSQLATQPYSLHSERVSNEQMRPPQRDSSKARKTMTSKRISPPIKSDEMLFSYVTATQMSPSSNSDELLFETETIHHRRRQITPPHYTSLPIRRSSPCHLLQQRKMSLTVEVPPESGIQANFEGDLSSRHHQDILDTSLKNPTTPELPAKATTSVEEPAKHVLRNLKEERPQSANTIWYNFVGGPQLEKDEQYDHGPRSRRHQLSITISGAEISSMSVQPPTPPLLISSSPDVLGWSNERLIEQTVVFKIPARFNPKVLLVQLYS